METRTERSVYEYAAAYACQRHSRTTGTAYEGTLLVVDMDRCAAGRCVCGRDGIRLTGEASAGNWNPDSFRTALDAIAPGTADRFAAEQERIRRVCRKYFLSGRAEDPETPAGVRCSQLEAAFADCAGQYRELFGKADLLLENADGLQRLLPIGDMADNCLADYCLRDWFSLSPFLPDPLFWEPEAGMVEKGRALYQASQSVPPPGRRVTLILLDAAGQETEFTLAEKDWPVSRLETPEYSVPFLLCRGEELQLTIDGNRQAFPMPPALTPDAGDLYPVCAAAGLRGGQFRLLLRAAGGEGPEIELPGPVE